MAQLMAKSPVSSIKMCLFPCFLIVDRAIVLEKEAWTFLTARYLIVQWGISHDHFLLVATLRTCESHREESSRTEYRSRSFSTKHTTWVRDRLWYPWIEACSLSKIQPVSIPGLTEITVHSADPAEHGRNAESWPCLSNRHRVSPSAIHTPLLNTDLRWPVLIRGPGGLRICMRPKCAFSGAWLSPSFAEFSSIQESRAGTRHPSAGGSIPEHLTLRRTICMIWGLVCVARTGRTFLVPPQETFQPQWSLRRNHVSKAVIMLPPGNPHIRRANWLYSLALWFYVEGNTIFLLVGRFVRKIM